MTCEALNIILSLKHRLDQEQGLATVASVTSIRFTRDNCILV